MDYTTIGASDVAGLAGGLGLAVTIPTLILAAVCLAAMWKIYTKAGKPGWAALIPIYDLYVLFEIINGRGISFLRLLIPFYNIYWAIKAEITLAKAFGKDTLFGLGLFFFGPIFQCILGFGSAEYQGPQDM